MAWEQRELFTATANLGDGRYNTHKKRQKVIANILRRWAFQDRRRKETAEEHAACEAGGTAYMKTAFREA